MTKYPTFFVLFIAFSALANTQSISPEMQKKIDAIYVEAESLAARPEIIGAVDAANENKDTTYATMTNDKWKTIGVRDPLVKSLASNSPASFIKSRIKSYISEAFLSNKDGTKVAFLQKTSNWNHAGKPKHDEPMKGKRWQGTLELDESSGINQVQISVPVLKDGKPIGSLVFGIAVARL